jgi:hypothetical protein
MGEKDNKTVFTWKNISVIFGLNSDSAACCAA